MSARRKTARPAAKQRTATSHEDAAADPLARAMQHHRAGNFAAAASAYDEVLVLAPDRADVLHLRGVAAMQSGDASALLFLQRAVALAPASVPYRINLANALRIAEKLDASISLLDEVLADAADDAIVHAALARSLAARLDLERAVLHARRASELQPGSFAHLATLGSLLRRRGDHADARDVLRRAIEAAEQQPPARGNLATAWNDLGLVQQALGASDEAAGSYQKATELDPSFAEAFNNIGELALRAERYEAAIASFEKALALGGDRASIESNLGNALRATGALREAEQHYRRAIELRPDFPSAHSNLGNVLREQGSLDEAAQAYLRAIDLEPGFALSYSNLGSLRRQQGDYDNAIQLFMRAKQLDPRLHTPYVALSWLLPFRGRSEELPAIFMDWNRYLPDDPIGRHMRAAADESVTPPTRASSEYVAALFDDFAGAFDATLARLEYRGPQVVTAALIQTISSTRLRAVLDAGCGTGLCGPLLRPYAERLEGVDLSERMLRLAHERGVYDRLERADLIEFLNRAGACYDAIVLADVVNYFGDLRDLLLGIARSAHPHAPVVFTTEKGNDISTYHLMPSGRYCHAEGYLRDALNSTGLRLEALESAVARHELGRPVEVCVVVARVGRGH